MFKKEEPIIKVFNGQNIQEIYARMREALAAGNLRFLLDIDGTLSNFHPEKMKAFVLPYIVDLIYQLEKTCPGTVIFVTGRPKEEVLKLFKCTGGRDLFEALQKETGRIPNMICNHGIEAFFDSEKKEFPLNPAWIDFLTSVKNDALSKMLKFARDKLSTKGCSVTENKLGITISCCNATGETAGLLFEIKYTASDTLVSFAFHWRTLEEMFNKGLLPIAEKDSIFKEFHNIWQAVNTRYLADKSVKYGDKFKIDESSSCVAEFCFKDIDKGSMVHQCVKLIKGAAEDPLFVAMGDSAKFKQGSTSEFEGTDITLLQAAIALKGYAFFAAASNKTPKDVEEICKALQFSGALMNVKDGEKQDRQANATLKFLRDSGLFDQCLLELMPSTAQMRKGFRIRSSCSSLPTF